jgi:hypothetical protein
VKYVIWNKDKWDSELKDIHDVVKKETSTGYSYSSIVETPNIKLLIDSFEMETDIRLGYSDYDTYNKLIIGATT